MPEAGGILDAETIADLRQLDRDSPGSSFLKQLVLLFQTNAPVRLGQIHTAIAQRDGDTLCAVAHTLKSNCSMLGARRMADYCDNFEGMGERREFEPAASLFPAAEYEFARVLAAVGTLSPNP